MLHSTNRLILYKFTDKVGVVPNPVKTFYRQHFLSLLHMRSQASARIDQILWTVLLELEFQQELCLNLQYCQNINFTYLYSLTYLHHDYDNGTN